MKEITSEKLISYLTAEGSTNVISFEEICDAIINDLYMDCLTSFDNKSNLMSWIKESKVIYYEEMENIDKTYDYKFFTVDANNEYKMNFLELYNIDTTIEEHFKNLNKKCED